MRSRFVGLGVLVGLLAANRSAHAEPAVAIVDGATSQQIVSFDTATPGTVAKTTNVTGLGQSEKLLAIDVRPTTGVLHALSSDRKLYSIDANGAATLLITLTEAQLGVGDKFDMDFNPTGEAVRLINTTSRLNIRVVLAPAVAIGNGGSNDQPLSYTSVVTLSEGPNVVGIGYANNYGQTTTTRLFGINVDLKDGVQPNDYFEFVELTNGTAANFDKVNTVKALGFNVANTNGAYGGMDISSNSNLPFFALVPDSDATKSHLYRASAFDNTATFTDLGAFAGTTIVRDIAILPDVPAHDGVLVTKDSTGHKISRFSSRTPGTLTGTIAITGLAAGENILAVDRRPKDARLYALTSASRLVLIDRATGAATAVGTQPFTPALVNVTLAGMDFNPSGDKIRVVSGAQNFVLDPDTGAATAATNLAFDPADPHAADTPNASAAAYTNNFADAGATRLYVYSNKVLASQGFALDGGTLTNGFNGGQLVTVADLNVNATNTMDHSFDVVGTNEAFLALTTTNARRLYTVDLTTGQLRYGLKFGDAAEATESIVGMSFDAPPAPPVGADAGIDGGNVDVDGGPIAEGDSGTTTDGGPQGGDGSTEGGGCDCSTTSATTPAGGASLAAGVAVVLAFLRKKKSAKK